MSGKDTGEPTEAPLAAPPIHDLPPSWAVDMIHGQGEAKAEMKALRNQVGRFETQLDKAVEKMEGAGEKLESARTAMVNATSRQAAVEVRVTDLEKTVEFWDNAGVKALTAALLLAGTSAVGFIITRFF